MCDFNIYVSGSIEYLNEKISVDPYKNRALDELMTHYNIGDIDIDEINMTLLIKHYKELLNAKKESVTLTFKNMLFKNNYDQIENERVELYKNGIMEIRISFKNEDRFEFLIESNTLTFVLPYLDNNFLQLNNDKYFTPVFLSACNDDLIAILSSLDDCSLSSFYDMDLSVGLKDNQNKLHSLNSTIKIDIFNICVDQDGNCYRIENDTAILL